MLLRFNGVEKVNSTYLGTEGFGSGLFAGGGGFGREGMPGLLVAGGGRAIDGGRPPPTGRGGGPEL